jgi:hypothetical protein
MIDIYHSRRTKYESVPYYTDAPNRELSKWVLTAKPSGYIYCQPVDVRNIQRNQVNNAMMFDQNTVVLLTSDDCDNLSAGNVLLYRGHPWIVDDLRQELHLKESEFGHNHYETYIYIRR